VRTRQSRIRGCLFTFVFLNAALKRSPSPARARRTAPEPGAGPGLASRQTVGHATDLGDIRHALSGCGVLRNRSEFQITTRRTRPRRNTTRGLITKPFYVYGLTLRPRVTGPRLGVLAVLRLCGPTCATRTSCSWRLARADAPPVAVAPRGARLVRRNAVRVVIGTVARTGSTARAPARPARGPAAAPGTATAARRHWPHARVPLPLAMQPRTWDRPRPRRPDPIRTNGGLAARR